MERYDARKETYEEIEIFDTLALFSSGRIQKDSVPEGFYCSFMLTYGFIVMKFGMMMSVWEFHVN